jgi:hypothetical protein
MGYFTALLVLCAGCMVLAALGHLNNQRQWRSLQQVIDNGDFRVSTREGKAADSAALLAAVGAATGQHPINRRPALYSVAFSVAGLAALLAVVYSQMRH